MLVAVHEVSLIQVLSFNDGISIQEIFRGFQPGLNRKYGNDPRLRVGNVKPESVGKASLEIAHVIRAIFEAQRSVPMFQIALECPFVAPSGNIHLLPKSILLTVYELALVPVGSFHIIVEQA